MTQIGTAFTKAGPPPVTDGPAGGVAPARPSGWSVLGPVMWKVSSEIIPGHIRGRAGVVTMAINWGAAFLVSLSFLSLIGAIGDSFTFRLFALFWGIGSIWVCFGVPESEGRSLEDIQKIWSPRT